MKGIFYPSIFGEEYLTQEEAINKYDERQSKYCSLQNIVNYCADIRKVGQYDPRWNIDRKQCACISIAMLLSYKINQVFNKYNYCKLDDLELRSIFPNPTPETYHEHQIRNILKYFGLNIKIFKNFTFLEFEDIFETLVHRGPLALSYGYGFDDHFFDDSEDGPFDDSEDGPDGGGHVVVLTGANKEQKSISVLDPVYIVMGFGSPKDEKFEQLFHGKSIYDTIEVWWCEKEIWDHPILFNRLKVFLIKRIGLERLVGSKSDGNAQEISQNKQLIDIISNFILIDVQI